MASFNDQIIEEFRANEGRVGGMFEGAPLLLLTTTGRKSGEPRVSPLVHSGAADGDGYVIAASKAGADTHPAWFLNIQADPAVRVEVGTETFGAPHASPAPRSENGYGRLHVATKPTSATMRRPPRGSSRWWCSSASSRRAARGPSRPAARLDACLGCRHGLWRVSPGLRPGLEPRRAHPCGAEGRGARLHDGLGCRPDRDPLEDRDAVQVQLERVVLRPAGGGFLEALTVLAFLAGATEKVKLGISVLVAPYRDPLYWAKIATTVDQLSQGRLVLGLGVGWMKEEFDALGRGDLFKARGRVADEQITILRTLLTEEHCSFHGEFYDFEDIAFQPKSYDPDHPLELWIGGEAKVAQRRAGRVGDPWFPYFPRITPEDMRSRYDLVRQTAEESGRDPDDVR